MKRFLINILIAAVLTVLAFFAVNKAINWYTMHGDTVEIPDVKKLNFIEAQEKISKLNLIPIILDSVYSGEFEKMAITDQDPDPKRIVKEGRKVYLTINSLQKPKVRMPKLVNKSLNLGKALLKNTGLKLGKVTTKYSLFGSGVILQQYLEGDTVVSGRLVEKDKEIDLLVSKYIDIDSVFIIGVDTSLIEGWEYKLGFMNEKARKSAVKRAKDDAKRDSAILEENDQ